MVIWRRPHKHGVGGGGAGGVDTNGTRMLIEFVKCCGCESQRQRQNWSPGSLVVCLQQGQSHTRSPSRLQCCDDLLCWGNDGRLAGASRAADCGFFCDPVRLSDWQTMPPWPDSDFSMLLQFPAASRVSDAPPGQNRSSVTCGNGTPPQARPSRLPPGLRIL